MTISGKTRGKNLALFTVHLHFIPCDGRCRHIQAKRPFTFDRQWDTTTHPERIYYRSDHFNYARKGIPIVFFTTGLHPQYHQVSDEPGLINYGKMARIGTLMYRSGLALGDRPTRPRPTGVQ